MFAEACVGVVIIASSLVAEVLTVGLVFAIVLSLVRLFVSDYGTVGGDAANAAKLKASLQIYSLAVVQNTLFYMWSWLNTRGIHRASVVRKQCGFGRWGLVTRYREEAKLPRGWNLITFGVGLLGSESRDDRWDAVRLLDTLVRNKIPVAPKLLPCKGPLENLIEMLELGNGETRERAARIVAALAGDLRHIDQFPSAVDHIASLFQQASNKQWPTGTGTTTKSMQELEEEEAGRKLYSGSGLIYRGILSFLNIKIYRTFKNKEESDTSYTYGEPKQLLSQGLLIIERLTQHQGNCVHICNNHVLLSKITAPLNSAIAFHDDTAEYGSEWIDILSSSLRILARLIHAPEEASRGLRNEIASNTLAVANLTRILEGDRFGPVLKAPAIQILADLASSDKTLTSLGKGDKHKFITRLWGIFFAAPQKDGTSTGDNNNNRTTLEDEEETQQEQATRLRHKAGEALVQMLTVLDAGSSSDILQILIPSGSEGHVVGQLTCMLIAGNSKGCHQSQTWAAEILKCLCSHLTNEQRQLPRQDVVQMLSKVLQLIISIQREESDGATARAAGADSNHATQSDEENPRPAEDHAAGNQSSPSTCNDEKEFLLALLSLAVMICDGTMVNAHDFVGAAPVDTVLLVTKLKQMIETNNDASIECLQIVKLSCQLVFSMVQLVPSLSVEVFVDHSFVDALSKSSESLSDLDNCLMLFDVNYHQVTKTDKPLASLVKQAQELFDKAQELGNNSPALLS